MKDTRPSTPESSYRLVADAVVTGAVGDEIARPGVVDVAGSRIAYAGTLEDAPDSPDVVKEIGGLLMPGLVNTHAHTPMTLFRSAGDGLALDRWLQESIWPREAHLSDEDVYWGMSLGCEELLCNGVTTTTEMYVRDTHVVTAVLESGIRAVVTPGIMDIPGAGSDGSWQRFLEAAIELYAKYNGADEKITVGFGPHSAYVLPRVALEQVAHEAAQVGALVHIHLSETRAEERVVRERHGCGAPEVLARSGILENRVLAAHAVWMSDQEMDLLASFGSSVAHCPSSNGKLGSGIARVSAMIARGIRVGLGTDGPASNDSLDLWEEMRLAPLLARAAASDATAISTGDAFKMATAWGADALGIEAGTLEAGLLADIVRIDIDDGCLTPALCDAELIAHLVWAASSRLVTDVWVGGTQVVADAKCLTVDADEAIGEVSSRARRIYDAAHG